MMKVFLDTAHLLSIKKWAATGLIDGVTTNPSHLSKEGGDLKKLIKEICAVLPEGDISVEVTQKNPDDVYKQAKEIAALAENIVVKIPCHADYFEVIHRLVEEGVPVNITLVFTLIQGMLMSKLGVRYISPFVGRWDDIDVDGIALISQLREMVDDYDYSTEVLAASIRSVRHFHDSIESGANAITLPIDVFEKSIVHPLTDKGIALFDADWQKLGIKQFP
jgi:transaldolase